MMDCFESIVISKRFYKRLYKNAPVISVPVPLVDFVDSLFFKEERKLAFKKGIVYVENQDTVLFGFQTDKDEKGNYTVFTISVTGDNNGLHNIILLTTPDKKISWYSPSNDCYFDDKKDLFDYITKGCWSEFIAIQSVALRKKRVIDKVRSEYQNSGSSKTDDSKQPEYKVHLNKDVIYRYKPSERHRDFVRHCEAWSVRGHYRNYKSGKTIFIQPYIKGKGRLNNKVYIEGT